jgi:hypothetical protein
MSAPPWIGDLYRSEFRLQATAYDLATFDPTVGWNVPRDNLKNCTI